MRLPWCGLTPRVTHALISPEYKNGPMKTSPDSSSDFVAHAKYGFTHFLTFRGRSTRPQFWWYCLCLWLINTAISMPASLFINEPKASGLAPGQSFNIAQIIWLSQPASYKVYMVVSTIIGSILGISLLAAAVRRLHDAGYSATLAYIVSIASILLTAYLLLFSKSDFVLLVTENSTTAAILLATALLAYVVMLVMGIIVLVRLVMPSEPRDNAYGPYVGREK